MSPGPEPKPSHETYIETVEALYAEDATDETGGVPAYVVAEELEIPVNRAAYHLDGLVERGELADEFDFPSEKGGRYKRGFKPVNSTAVGEP